MAGAGDKPASGPALPSLSDLPGGPLFMGRYAHSLDDKRRVAIPKVFREELKLDENTIFFAIPAFSDPCLYLYTEAQFRELKARLAKMQEPSFGVGDEAIRKFRREIFSRGAKLSPDKQGRVVLPPDLCAFVGIEKDVIFLGVDDHIELWSPAQEQLTADPEGFRRLSKGLLG